MICLKHLAQEFEADPRRLRAQLRKKFGKHPRWKWENEDDPELIQIRKYLSKIYGQSTSGSPPSTSGSRKRSTRSLPDGMLADRILKSHALETPMRYGRA